METVTIELSLELLKLVCPDMTDPSGEVVRLLALGLFREEKVSLGRAAELCQTPLAIFMDFAAKHGVPPLRYSLADLEEDRRTMD